MRERRLRLCFILWLLVSLASARAALMSGSVVDDLGETITGLRLEFGNDAGSWFLADLRDGKYEVNLIPGTWRVKRWLYYWDGREVDYFDKEYLIPVGDSAVVTNLVFPKLRSQIEGSLRTPSGDPLQMHIIMNATLNGESVHAFAYPDTNGIFAMRLPNATWSVQPAPVMVDQAGYVPVAARTITLANETNATAQFVISPATNIVRGQVVDDTGAPVGNLRMPWSSGGGFWRDLTTDADGNYSFAAHPDRWAPIFDGLRERRLAATYSSRPLVDVVEGAEVTTCNVRLFRLRYDIHVRLVDERGNPYTSGSSSMTVQGTLDGERVELYAEVINGQTDIAVDSGSWSLNWSETVNVTTESVDVTLVIPPTNTQSRFFGKVVDEKGLGISNFGIQATWNGAIETTDADGNFGFVLPTDTVYARWTDTNYVMANAYGTPTPDHPVERVITARRVTGAIIVKLNFPEGEQPSSMSVEASTRVAGSHYTVYDLNGTNSVMRLPVFPGTWRVTPFIRGVEPRIVEVGANDVEVVFNIPAQQGSRGTVRGKVILPSGSPLKWVGAGLETGDQVWEFGETDGEGRFSFQTAGKCTVGIYAGNLAIKVAADVKEGMETDVGTIQLPERNVKAVFTFVDETGAPIKFSGYYQNEVHLTHDAGGVKIELFDGGMQNQRSALLAPGMWKVEAETRDAGFAVATPMMLEVGQSDVQTNIVLRRLGNRATAPTLDILNASNGPRVRGVSTTGYIDIETSSDLKVWKYFATQPMTNSIFDLNVSGTVGGSNVYFRAANADFPAVE
jgi:hypothetical protein